MKQFENALRRIVLIARGIYFSWNFERWDTLV